MNFGTIHVQVIRTRKNACSQVNLNFGTCSFKLEFRESDVITKTYLYNLDPLKPHFYTVKLGFTGVHTIFLISAENIDCGYSLEPPRFEQKNEKISDFLIWKFSVFWWWDVQYIWIGVFPSWCRLIKAPTIWYKKEKQQQQKKKKKKKTVFFLIIAPIPKGNASLLCLNFINQVNKGL